MARAVDFKAGTDPTADELDALVEYFAHLTADHPDMVNNTQADVTGLTLDLPTGFTFLVETVIFHTCASNTPDIDIRFQWSGTTSLYRDWADGTAAAVTGAVPTALSDIGSGTSTTEYTFGTANNVLHAVVRAIMTTTSAGTLKVQAAQNVTTGGSAVQIQEGSYLRAKIMA